MIYVTGDCHSEFHKFNMASFPEQVQLGRNDYMIICGDFGGVWDWKGESKHERFWLQWLEEKPYTTLFVDGNHENFERLNGYPEREWHGGRVHEIRPHVLHLIRGYIFDIDGISLLAFGGAASHDIDGGIFEPDDPILHKRIKRARINEKPYRINHRTWWKEEMPSDSEKERCLLNLKAANNKVDVIISHDCPSSILQLLSGDLYDPNGLNVFLEEIRNTVEYKFWLFGHHHDDRSITEKDILLYDQLVRIV